MSSTNPPTNTGEAVTAFIDVLTNADRAFQDLEEKKSNEEERHLERTLRELPAFVLAEYNRGKAQLGRVYSEDGEVLLEVLFLSPAFYQALFDFRKHHMQLQRLRRVVF